MRKLIVAIKEAQEAWSAGRLSCCISGELIQVALLDVRMHALIEERLGEKYPGDPLDNPKVHLTHNTCRRCAKEFMSTGPRLTLGLCEKCLKQERARLRASRAYKLWSLIDWTSQPMED